MTTTEQEAFSPTEYNSEFIVLWFDDLGTGNAEYRFLSNFFQGEPITLPGVTWENLLTKCGVDLTKGTPLSMVDRTGPIEFITGEHAFAAMKFWGTDWTHFRDIVDAREYTDTYMVKGKQRQQYVNAPNHAKSLGRSRKHPLRPDWEVMKLDVMAGITRAKYAQDREEAIWLLDTGDRLLVEGTYWADEVWGVDLNLADLPGRNWLGSLLMMRRAELRAVMAASDHKLVQHFVNETVNHSIGFAL